MTIRLSHRRDETGSDPVIAVTYSRVANLVGQDNPKYGKILEIAGLPMAEVRDVERET